MKDSDIISYGPFIDNFSYPTGVSPSMQNFRCKNFGIWGEGVSEEFSCAFALVAEDHFLGDLGPIHTQELRARDHCTSSTLIGGKSRAGPRSLHTMLEGPLEYVNARWM